MSGLQNHYTSLSTNNSALQEGVAFLRERQKVAHREITKVSAALSDADKERRKADFVLKKSEEECRVLEKALRRTEQLCREADTSYAQIMKSAGNTGKKARAKARDPTLLKAIKEGRKVHGRLLVTSAEREWGTDFLGSEMRSSARVGRRAKKGGNPEEPLSASSDHDVRRAKKGNREESLSDSSRRGGSQKGETKAAPLSRTSQKGKTKAAPLSRTSSSSGSTTRSRSGSSGSRDSITSAAPTTRDSIRAAKPEGGAPLTTTSSREPLTKSSQPSAVSGQTNLSATAPDKGTASENVVTPSGILSHSVKGKECEPVGRASFKRVSFVGAQVGSRDSLDSAGGGLEYRF